MKILVTGAAGFIGFHTCLKLVNLGHEVYGIDNINDYYDPKLKFDRLNELGFNEAESKLFKNEVQSIKFKHLRFARIDLVNNESINDLFRQEQFEVVCNLAAQAGVRYSIENPRAYINSNISGFLNILEGCRNHKVKHLVYASSSSVYGKNKKVPFETTDNVDHPISLYAATKKSNELMAHAYSHLYSIPTTGLRFFTVYGPWGRPDMAIYLFADAIAKGRSIKVFNNGNMSRDFTYIDDIVNGIEILLQNPPKLDEMKTAYRISNIGNGSPETLLDFIKAIETSFGVEAKKVYLQMQAGDVPQTWADISELEKLGYKSTVSIEEGVNKFAKWYRKYHNILSKENC
tara:strand:+ start:397 stop:1434 length:1038 start_codon:yes stop_codon:yes gene_type:complete